MTTFILRSAVPVHHTGVDDSAWDGPANEARLSSDDGAAVYRRAFAWTDPDADPDTKAAYRFVHHFVAEDGSVGDASLRACSAGIGVLNGGRGGTTIPDADREGVHRHLAAHMMDGGMEPPDLRSAPLTGGLERRTFPVSELRAVTADDGSRSIQWYAAVFDSMSEDLGGFREKINRRAFTQTVANADIRALWNHDPNYVLGRNKSGSLSLKVDLHGLVANVTPPDTQWARDLMVSIDRGDVSAGSFGFQVLNDRWSEDEDGVLVRELREVKLFDVSVVTFPAYPATEGVSLRSLMAGAGLDLPTVGILQRARSGDGLTDAERAQMAESLAWLRDYIGPSSDAGPVIPTTPDGGHLLRASQRRRQLELIAMGGR